MCTFRNINFSLLLISIFLLSSTFVFPEEVQKEKIPQGMEVIQGGRIKVIIPQGSRKRKEGNLTIVESTEAYLSRKFLEMEKRFGQLEAKEEKLKEEIRQLRETLDKVQKSILVFGESKEEKK